MDVDLFGRFLDGDDAAFADLFDRHNQRLFTYCMKILGDAGEAEDITQEIWERTITMRSKPRPVDNPVGFLLTIARNLCLNRLKVARRTSSYEDLSEGSLPVHRPHDPSELEELVIQNLPKLPFDFREVLVLTAYCGYDYDEIAGLLGTSVEAIRMRASRARSRLRGLIIDAMQQEQERMNRIDSTRGPGGKQP